MNQLCICRVYALLIIVFSIVARPVCAGQKDIVVATNVHINKQIIDQTFSDPFLLERLTFDTDVYFQKKEFDYLTGMQEEETYSATHVKEAVIYLVKKNKFFEIRLRVSDGVEGKWLHFTLVGFWTFQKLKVQGVLRGKDAFRQYYIMEPGDPFDSIKHKHSIDKIHEMLKHDGYFNHTTHSSLMYDHETKSITVQLFVQKGNRFRIGTTSIDISADERVAQDEILLIKEELYKKFIRRIEGNVYCKDAFNEIARAIKECLGKKGFLQATIGLEEHIDHENGKISLQWVIDLHQKRSFVFWGNQFFSHTKLLNQILQFGRSAWLLPASILAEEIERAYKDKGFWKIEVKSQEEKDRSFFLINEGQRAIVQLVEIQPIVHFERRVLIKGCFKQMLKRAYFDKHLLEQSLDKLCAWYLKEGFLDFAIVDYSFEPLEMPHAYRLVVIVDEGVRSYLSSVTIEGYPELQCQGPFNSFTKQKDPVLFDMQILSKQRQWLLNHFHQLGFLYAHVHPDIDTDDNHTVSVKWHIELRNQIRFGKIVVLGSNMFPFSYITRELQYQQDAAWDQDKLRQSFLRLKELEVFDMIHLYSDQSDELPQKSIILKLHKDDPFEIRARVGFELQHIRKYQTFAGITYKLGGSFLFKNPFNKGDQIRFDIDITRSHREIVGRYKLPWLFNLPLRTSIEGYSITHNHPGFIGSNKDVYRVKQHGFLVGMYRKTKHLDVGTSVGIEWMETTIHDTQLADCLSRAINFEPQLLDKTIPFFFIEPTFFLDFLDHKLHPTQGTLTVLSVKGMFPINSAHRDSYFIKVLFEQSLFVPIRSLVGAFRLRFGHIFHRMFRSIMPTERFYLGGSHSLRGYETDFAPPLGQFIDEEGKEHAVPRGGKSMLNANLELRFPLFKKIGGVVFQDIGLLSQDQFADFSTDNVLLSTGFGIRFYTPLGPLRFDIGWKWRTRKPVERSYAWFLNFGHAF